MSIEKTLAERSKTHGDFLQQAYTAQYIKRHLRRQRGWENLDESQIEALDMIVGKISRIIHGDPRFEDHWLDIAGYAILGKTRRASTPEDKREKAIASVKEAAETRRAEQPWYMRNAEPPVSLYRGPDDAA